MSEWKYVHINDSESFWHMQSFGFKLLQDGKEIEFIITVREYINPPDPAMRFYAQSDKQMNQQTAPFTPTGWGTTLLSALSECINAIRRFRYEPSNAATA